MFDVLSAIVLLAATVATGLLAGLYYGVSCAWMLTLRRTDDHTFVRVMQRMNVAIVNGWFLVVFLGAPLLSVLAVVLSASAADRAVLPWVVAGAVLNLLAIISTARRNIPLNDDLDAAGDPDRIPDIAAVRERFEMPWVRWNLVRTVACTAALGCLGYALLAWDV